MREDVGPIELAGGATLSASGQDDRRDRQDDYWSIEVARRAKVDLRFLARSALNPDGGLGRTGFNLADEAIDAS